MSRYMFHQSFELAFGNPCQSLTSRFYLIPSEIWGSLRKFPISVIFLKFKNKNKGNELFSTFPAFEKVQKYEYLKA